MKLWINSQEHDCEYDNLAQLVLHLGYATRPVVVAVNQTHILRSQWATHTLNEGDVVDILVAIVGG
jgi:thiamine biosynthesis protein ThiS